MGEPKIIRLMCDYSADPIWVHDPDHSEFGACMDLDDIPFRPKTRDRLRTWADMYEASNLWTSPEFHWTPAEADAFEREGIALWHLFRTELAPAYEVVYFSERLNRDLAHPDEIEGEPLLRFALDPGR